MAHTAQVCFTKFKFEYFQNWQIIQNLPRARVPPDYGCALSYCYCVTRQVKHVPPKSLPWKMLLGAGRYSSIPPEWMFCSSYRWTVHACEHGHPSAQLLLPTTPRHWKGPQVHRCVIVWALVMKCACSPLHYHVKSVFIMHVTFTKINNTSGILQ